MRLLCHLLYNANLSANYQKLIITYQALTDELLSSYDISLSNVDINFDNLLSTFLTTNPRETFYQKVFGKSYAEVRADSVPQSVND